MTKAEFGRLCGDYAEAHKSEAAAKEVKAKAAEALVAADGSMFDLDGDGKEFFFDSDAKGGVRRITPEAKDVLDVERALAYAKKKGLDCIITTETLDKPAFLALAKGKKVPAATLRSMVTKSTPGKPYVKFLGKEPKEEE